jgi:hypothetical protein
MHRAFGQDPRACNASPLPDKTGDQKLRRKSDEVMTTGIRGVRMVMSDAGAAAREAE